MEQAVKLLESLLSDPEVNQEALDKLVEGILKNRSDAKKNKSVILFQGLVNYGLYGPDNSFTNRISNEDLLNIKAEELAEVVKGITRKEHRMLYYGPKSTAEVVRLLDKHHLVDSELQDLPELIEYEERSTANAPVYWVDYDMVQTELIFLSRKDEYDPSLEPRVSLFNEYFGGNMSSIVFQEMREAQGLAYSVFSQYTLASKKDKPDYVLAYIGTQADKLPEAMEGMFDLLNELPKSENSFETSKKSLLSRLESSRITKAAVLFNYEIAQRKGLERDIRKDIYEFVKEATFEDIKTFHEDYVEGSDYVILLIGSRDKIDFDALQNYGEVIELTLDEVFGYPEIGNRIEESSVLN
jgi:predicted Zn-dependent peptidase